MLELPNVKDEIANGKQVTVVNKTTGDTIVADCEPFRQNKKHYHCRRSA